MNGWEKAKALIELLGRRNNFVVTMSIDDKLPNSYILHCVVFFIVEDNFSLILNSQNIFNGLYSIQRMMCLRFTKTS